MRNLLVSSMVLSIILTSCVSKKKFSTLESNNNKNKNELTETKSSLERCLAVQSSNEDKIAELEERVDYLKNNNMQMLDRLADLSVLSKSESENLRESLERIAKKDHYIKELQNAMASKDSLNMQLVLNLKGALGNVNDEDIEIKVEKGVVFISISDKLLFSTASYRVSNKAVEMLGKVATVLNDKPDIEIMVEGYTDSRRIRNEVLQDNWDLSVKRATSVVRILQDKYKVSPERMMASGRGHYHPVASNDSAQGRAKNRRTRIVILPKLDQFFELLEKKQ